MKNRVNRLAGIVSVILASAAAGAAFGGAWTTDKLTVAGDGFKFAVSPPDNWSARTGNPPRFKYQAVLMVWPRPRGVAVPLVTVDAKIKTARTPEKELDEILKNYSKTRPETSISDLKIKHGDYSCVGKSVGITGKFHQYLVFLDPGKEYHYWIVASMRVMQ